MTRQDFAAVTPLASLRRVHRSSERTNAKVSAPRRAHQALKAASCIGRQDVRAKEWGVLDPGQTPLATWLRGPMHAASAPTREAALRHVVGRQHLKEELRGASGHPVQIPAAGIAKNLQEDVMMHLGEVEDTQPVDDR